MDDELEKLAAEIGLTVPASSTTSPIATKPSNKTAYTQAELEDALRRAGFKDEATIGRMGAIGMAESSLDKQGRARIDSFNPGIGAGGRPTKERSAGPWQINTLAHPEYDKNKLLSDLDYNAKAAYDVFYKKKQGLKAWGAYTDGRYRKFYKGKPVSSTLPSQSDEAFFNDLYQQVMGPQEPSPTTPKPVAPIGSSPFAAETGITPASPVATPISDALKTEVNNALSVRPDVDRSNPQHVSPTEMPTAPVPTKVPVPEAPETLEAQLQAMNDPQSTRAAVLFTKGEKIPPIDDAKEFDLQLPTGETLRVNSEKYDAIEKALGRPIIDEIAKGGDYTPLLGGKAQPTTDTANKTAVVTRDAKTGTELVASSIETPDAAAKEAQFQKAQFPNRPTTTKVETTDKVVADRQSAFTKTPQPAGPLDYERTGVLKTNNGSSLRYVADDPTYGVAPEEGYERFADDNGQTYLLNKKTGKLEDESLSKIAISVPVKLVSYNESSRVPVAEAKKRYLTQVADEIGTQQKLDPKDVYEWLQKEGTVDIKTKQSLPDERYYETREERNKTGAAQMAQPSTYMSAQGDTSAPPPDIQGGVTTHSLTGRQLNDLTEFARQRSQARTDYAIDQIAKGSTPNAAQLERMGIDPATLQADPRFRSAIQRGQAMQQRIGQVAQTIRANDPSFDEYSSMVAARGYLGLMPNEDANKEIDAYRSLRQRSEDQNNVPVSPIVSYGLAKVGSKVPDQTAELEIARQRKQEWVERGMADYLRKYGSFAAAKEASEQAAREKRAADEKIKNDPWGEWALKAANQYTTGIAKSAVKGVGDVLEGMPVYTKPIADYIDSVFGTKSATIKDHLFTRFGQWIRDRADEYLPTDKNYDQSFLYGAVPQGVGSSLTFMPAALGGPLGIAAFATAQMAGGNYEDALRDGATETQAQTYARWSSGLLGWTETLGLGNTWARLLKGEAKHTWKNILLEAVKEGAEETLLNEGPQDIGQNLLAKITYDPNRAWDKDIAEQIGAAGVSAPLVSVLVSALLHIKHRSTLNRIFKEDFANGGPNVRDFGDEGGLYVYGKEVGVTDDIKPLLEKHRKLEGELRTYFDQANNFGQEIKGSNTRDRYKETPAWRKRFEDRVARAMEVAKQQKEVADQIAELSGVPKPSILEQKEQYDAAKNETVSPAPIEDQKVKDETGNIPVRNADRQTPINEEATKVQEQEPSVEPPALAKDQSVEGEAEKVGGKPKPKPLSNTQVEFSKEDAKVFDDFRRTIIDDADVADRSDLPEYAKDGLYEIEPHITLKYGLHTNKADDVADMFEGERPIKVKLGKTAVFKGAEKKIPGTDKPVPYDVIIVEVDSPDLARLNKKVSEGSENTTTFEYKPHVTLGYVKQGLGEKYEGRTDFEGQEFTFDGVTFSPADKSGKTVIPVGKKATRPVTEFGEKKAQGMVAEPPKNRETLKASENKVAELEKEVAEERRKGETDTLTGLANQNAWKAAQKRIEADKSQEVISFDVNRLKSANDTTDHDTIDNQVFAPIGKKIAEVLEKNGVDVRNGFRSGGDEFTVAVPKGQAAKIRDEIEKAVGAIEVVAEKDYVNSRTGEKFKKGDVIPVTLSGEFGQTVADAEKGLGKRKEASKTANPVKRVEQQPTIEPDIAKARANQVPQTISFPNDQGSFTSVRILYLKKDSFTVESTVRKANDDGTTRIQTRTREVPNSKHADFVRDLQERAKSRVNAEVLADYPDLAPKKSAKPEKKSARQRLAEKGEANQSPARETKKKGEVQTESDNDIESLPPSQRVTPDDLADDVTFKAVEKKAQKERTRKDTGFTKSQTEYFVKRIQETYDQLPVRNAEALRRLETEFRKLSRNRLKPGSANWRKRAAILAQIGETNGSIAEKGEARVTIKVPADGTFTFYSQQGADRIHKKLTGKTVLEFRSSDKSAQPSARQKLAEKGNESLKMAAEEGVEIPLDSLYTSDGDINYGQVQDTVDKIFSGSHSIQRLSREGEQGRIDGGGLLVGSSLIVGRESRTNAKSDSRKKRNREEALLEGYAKSQNAWVSDIQEFKAGLGKRIGRGMEVEAYEDPTDPNFLIKIAPIPYFIGEDSSFLRFFDDKIALHNTLPHIAPYELVGFGQDLNTSGSSTFHALLRQPYIRGEETTSLDDAFVKQMQGDGFVLDYTGSQFKGNDVAVLDVTTHNVIKAEDGNYYIFDPMVSYIDDENYQPFDLVKSEESLKMAAEESAPTFFSQVERVIEQKMPNKASAEQIKGILSPNNGVKAEELEWLDIDSFLKDNPKPTKAELLEYVRANNADVQEVEKVAGGGRPAEQEREYRSRQRKIYERYEAGRISRSERDAEYEALDLLFPNTFDPTTEPKFSTYVLPGGENYKELLLTLPPKIPQGWTATRTNAPDASFSTWEITDADGKRVTSIVGGDQDAALRKAAEGDAYKSSHWSEPNVLAHVRFDERDGGKTLHVAEIQSDFGQQLRKERGKIEKALEKDFEAIVMKMAESGEIDIVC